MQEIRSSVDGNVLCRFIRKEVVAGYRFDMSDANENLQVSARKFSAGTKVAPHKHNPLKRNTIGTQEAWVVIEGRVMAYVYDIDDKFIDAIELHAGDAIVYFRGGHALNVLEDNTIFYEFKNGPYYGYENDKEPIE